MVRVGGKRTSQELPKRNEVLRGNRLHGRCPPSSSPAMGVEPSSPTAAPSWTSSQAAFSQYPLHCQVVAVEFGGKNRWQHRGICEKATREEIQELTVIEDASFAPMAA